MLDYVYYDNEHPKINYIYKNIDLVDILLYIYIYIYTYSTHLRIQF